MAQRVDDLVSRLTLEEKAAQMVNTAPSIPRLGIPAYDWWSEGLHGIARSGFATLFPQAIGNAATFDAPLLAEIGTVVSVEARAKHNEADRNDIHSIYFGLTIWSPNINIFRDPRWGRGQETYGEDPFLTASLGTSFVKGLQGDNPTYYRTIATPKHYAVHSGPESTRHKANIDPTPHDLWDTYLPAFRSTIVEGKADSIMCAYNAVEGKPACASDLLLKDILRKDWKFQGFVTSDCGAIDDFYEPQDHHTSSDAEHASVDGLRAGTDTNCGQTYQNLADAVHKGLISESEIDVSLKRLFTARMKLGLFDPPSIMPYASVPFSEVMSPEHTAIALQASREAMVLLKNDRNTLPLSPAKIKTIAVVGPNAASLAAIEGNYNAIPRDPVLPVDGIAAKFPLAKILYAQGSPYADNAATVIPRSQLRVAAGSSAEGLKAEYFDNDIFTGAPAVTRTDKQIDFDWNGASPAPGKINYRAFSVRWTGTIQVPAAGDYEITGIMAHCNPCNKSEHYTLTYNGKELAASEVSTDKSQHGAMTTGTKLHISDTSPHPIEITYSHTKKLLGAGFSLQWVPPVEPMRDQALDLIRKADITIAFVGLSPNLEGEEMPVHIPGFSGGDRTDIVLPAAQQQLLEAAKATGKPLVVVLMNGSAVAINWAQQNADAILEAWYPGQAGAQAIAETLVGENNPAGRLPVTFYTGVDQLPPFDDYSMANRTYRYFKGEPLYKFGYGLSYTSFSYSNLKLSTSTLHAGDTLTVEADVKNTGSRAGDEVSELYLTPPHTNVSPALALGGFTRNRLSPGETKHITFTLGPRTLSQVDDKGNRAVSPGSYRIAVGGSQSAGPNDQTVDFVIEGKQELPH
ncbi:glycoside hydrolase family 3 C-terminal domain-containing protein [Granulicella sp. S190]|uniref:glycoside hydrolase family 3 C-terminal domain-containing protein n=1 Tax=Granulicella sp. S190 TaxID=1747226 RepID=UPI00352B2983